MHYRVTFIIREDMHPDRQENFQYYVMNIMFAVKKDVLVQRDLLNTIIPKP